MKYIWWSILAVISAGVLVVLASLVAFVLVTKAEGLKEPVYPPYCYVQPPDSDLWYPCDSPEAKMADCNKLMETAMRAVDPYLDNMSLPENPRDKVLKVWDRAKNSCWSDLKDLQPQHYH